MDERRRITVVAALFLEGDRFLITQRPQGGSFPGFWEFPGGKVEAGEDDRSALLREIEEELGFRCEVGSLYSVLLHEYPAFTLDFRVYTCLRCGEEPRAIGVADLRWVTAAETDDLPFPPADEPILRLLQGKGQKQMADSGPMRISRS